MQQSDPKNTPHEPLRDELTNDQTELTDVEDFTQEDHEYLQEDREEEDYRSVATIEGAEITDSGGHPSWEKRDKVLIYGVLASLVLHLCVFAALTRVTERHDVNQLLKPGEKVSKVRLLEIPTPKKNEPPPKKPSAISDRDHIAKKERIPKRPPGSPIGTIVRQPKYMAALPPPRAPEDLVTPEPKQEPKDQVKPHIKEKSRPEMAKPQMDRPPRKKPERHEKSKKPQKRSALDGLDRSLSRVDLRPRLQDLRRRTERAPGAPGYFPDGDPEEVVVDMNTRQDRYFSYLLHIKKKIEGVWTYPQVAASAGIGGKLTLDFVIANDGRLVAVNLLDTSGHSILDQYAIRAIKAASPYFPFPPRMKMKRLRVRANFLYVTGRHFRRLM